MEDSYQEDMQSKVQGVNYNSDLAIKHRRKKNEIEKDYICGDAGCGRRYGTNAALYTHIKNKHQGVAPQGTIKPSSQQKKIIGKSENQEINSNINNDIVCNQPSLNKEEDERNEIYEVITSKEYVAFTLKVGQLGDNNNQNLIVRESNEDYYLLKEDQIFEYFNEILQRIQMITNYNCNSTLSKQASQFLVQASPYWKKAAIKELYFFLIYSYIMEGNHFYNYQDEINSQKTQYPLFVQILEGSNVENITEIYRTVWKQSNSLLQ